MCLSTIDKHKKKYTVGYKLVEVVRDGVFRGPYQTHFDHYRIGHSYESNPFAPEGFGYFARKSSAFLLKSKLELWKRLIRQYSPATFKVVKIYASEILQTDTWKSHFYGVPTRVYPAAHCRKMKIVEEVIC